MLTKGQAVRILQEDLDYEEKMFDGLVSVTLEDMKRTKLLKDSEIAEIERMLNVMIQDTKKHESMLNGLIEYAGKGGKDDF